MSQRIDKREIVGNILRELECNPFEILANLATNPLVDASVRRAAATDLAGYLAPKLKAAEVETDTREVQVHHPVELSDYRHLPKTETRHGRVSPHLLPGSNAPEEADLFPSRDTLNPSPVSDSDGAS